MELRENRAQGINLIQSYGDGGFRVRDRRVEGTMLITASRFLPLDVAGLDDLKAELLKEKLKDEEEPVEVLLIGTGAEIAFLPENTRAAIRKLSLAIDVMDTGAAARTYNVLAGEARRVAALLLPV